MANWHLATYQDNLFKNNLGIINLDNTLEKYVYKLQDPIDDSITSVNENNWLRIDITHADKTVSDWVTDNSSWTIDTNITGLVNGSVYWVYGAPYSYYTIIADGKSYRLESFSNTDGNITGKDINDSDVSIDRTTITKVIIGESVETIGDGAFVLCSNLASVTIGDSVTKIPRSAFSECSSLVSLTIPDSVTEIGFGAFFLCSSLVSVNIPAWVTSIDNIAFYKCYSLASLTIPDSVKTIGDYAFELCVSLASLTFGENSNLETIGTDAFSGINVNAIITIPQGVLTNFGLSYGTGQSFFGSPTTVTLQAPAST